MKRLYPRIFISHRHKDEDFAKALVDLLMAAFYIEKGDIRCTSVQLPPNMLTRADKVIK